VKRWWLALVAAVAGVGFTGTQIVERITTLRDPSTSLVCDVNAVLSCSNVLAAWQSSVIVGIPNAFIGAVMFTVLGTMAGIFLLTKSPQPVVLWIGAGLSTFFAAFATWFMMQTAFVIGALCLWCIAITTSIGIIAAVFTASAAETSTQGFARVLTQSRLLPWMWIAWWIVVAALVAIGLT
jgi:uncharacterized membrane protein